MRDHRKFEVFTLADALVMDVYRVTSSFPRSERYGLRSQLRRSAVSTASNIVEGCARRGEREFAQFINIAHASNQELAYQISVAARLHYIDEANAHSITKRAELCGKKLRRLHRSLTRLP